jgi:hypothetical protein
MSGLSSISGLTAFFAVTTTVVFLYPIVKLTPSWLERSLNKKIAVHRAAHAALSAAVNQSHNDPEQAARLAAQRDYHRSALQALAPHELAEPAAARTPAADAA